MKSPLAVRASEGKKYSTPDSGPTAFQVRGSWYWTATMTAERASAPAATAPPNRQLILLPARRCMTNSQTINTGTITCSQ